MPKGTTRKVIPPSIPEQDSGVVRLAKPIPPMAKPLVPREGDLEPEALPCSGRCGHCDLHPCRLHVPI